MIFCFMVLYKTFFIQDSLRFEEFFVFVTSEERSAPPCKSKVIKSASKKAASFSTS